MSLRMIALAVALGVAGTAAQAAPPAPQAATPPAAKGMTYDCTKAGNKTKAACKNVTPAGVAAPAKPGAAAAPAAAKKPLNYDCTKPGNKTKGACQNVVVPPAGRPMATAPAATPAAVAPVRPAPRAAAATNQNTVAATLKNGKVVHYDCAKTGNKDKKACGAK